MEALRRFYRDVWALDFEFTQPEGERPTPLCLVAREVLHGTLIRCWLDGTAPPSPPFAIDAQSLVMAYYSSAEMTCFLALGWEFPARILDLYSEFRCMSSGLPVPCGYGLLGALVACGLDAMGAEDKDTMRQLAMRGGPYTSTEHQALLDYCQQDVDALARLLPVMLPQIDIPRALLRGRYMCAAARIEWTGIPCDLEMLEQLRTHWGTIKNHIAGEVNRTHNVFLPAGQRVLDPQSHFGATVWRIAVERGLDPYRLAAAAAHVWQDTRALYAETMQACREARKRTGLTPALMTRWEDAGYDYARWPGLDTIATELAYEFPALGLAPWLEDSGQADVDYARSLWELLRDTEDRAPQKTDWDILSQAADLVEADPEGWDSAEPLAFSSELFEQYLVRQQLPWPRLPSGKLALDDDTFREMARAYPTAIGPIREVRYALSQLKLHELAVGRDGRNRCLLSAFGSSSSRNQPSTSKYIFGPACWLRSLIKPDRGRALAYVDWVQQELGIAAYLSQDAAMQDAYRSGDFYLTLAQMAGAVPPDATKATHGPVRDHYKTVALGALYGLSESGLARRLGIPLCDARRLMLDLREAFPRFWAWSDQIEIEGMLGGRLQTVFGWQMHAGPNVNPRSLRNFPMQANAAEMMRLACCLATERGIAVCGVVHDALLVEAHLDEIEQVVVDTQAAMEDASLLVLPGFPLRSEAKIVRYPDRYVDPRGVHMWKTVQTILHARAKEVPF